MIAKSFLVCEITKPVDGNQDSEIVCFRPDKACSAGREMLHLQMQMINTPETNTFIADDEDMAAACPEQLIIDNDDDDELDIES